MARKTPESASTCPCGRTDGRGRPLSPGACCGRYLANAASDPAPDAESLMRSRYTAFVRGDAGYLRATWHRDTQPPDVAIDADLRWLGLRVLQVSTHGDRAEVEFEARHRSREGRAGRLHERSRFVREGGRWYYVDGQLL